MNDMKNIAIISFQLENMGSVSAETMKWAKVYSSLGYNVHLIAGSFGYKPDFPSCEIPLMDYTDPQIRAIKRMAFESNLDTDGRQAFNRLVENASNSIKHDLRAYLKKNRIEMLSIENILSIPLNIPLGIVLKDLIRELRLPAIARHHDLYWERDYFMKQNNIPDILNSAFPPALKGIQHVTLTTTAKKELRKRKRIFSRIIPNSIEFEQIEQEKQSEEFREFFNAKDKFIFLQPTRIGARSKCIERSLHLVHEINKITAKDNLLIITGSLLYSKQYDKSSYCRYLEKLAKELNVTVHKAADVIGPDKRFSLGQAYLGSDVITLPSDVEGFGNPVIEAFAYKKPLFANNYRALKDILGKGFDMVLMRGRLTDTAVRKVYDILANKELRQKIVEHNYKLVRKYYAFAKLKHELKNMLEASKRETLMRKFLDKSLYSIKYPMKLIKYRKK